MEEKIMDLESMKKFIEEKFNYVKTVDIPICDKEEANLTYYFGYFKAAFEFEIISEDRYEEMCDELTELFNQKEDKYVIPAGQELHKVEGLKAMNKELRIEYIKLTLSDLKTCLLEKLDNIYIFLEDNLFFYYKVLEIIDKDEFTEFMDRANEIYFERTGNFPAGQELHKCE